MKKGNLLAAAGFAALAVFVIWESRPFPGSRGGVPGPAIFPVAVAVLMLMAALSLAINSLLLRPEEDKPLDILKPDCRRTYLCMAIMAVYLAALPEIGFCATSSLLLFGLIKWFGRYRFHVCALSSIAVTGIVYLVFSQLLYVPLGFGLLM